MKKIGIFGSTGSIGTQALDIIRENPDKYKIVFLAAHSNSKKLISQSKEFKPLFTSIYKTSNFSDLKEQLNFGEISSGYKALLDLCKVDNVDIILNAVSGYEGLALSIEILKSGTNLALANKESIVQAGHILLNLSKKHNAKILPVDSEHSALWQCALGEEYTNIRKIILTASGGPFRAFSKNKFNTITKEQALNHPNWKMGNKITIDSATMMNKGFEVIEAYWLFNVAYKNIDIIVHPQSIIHSFIQFIDGSIKAQLSEPTMKIPIQFALSFPDRHIMKNIDFDFIKNNNLTFESVDLDKFKCIKLAYEAGKLCGSSTTVLNVANDISVDLFLNDYIGFEDIPIIIDKCLQRHDNIVNPNLDEIKATIFWTREFITTKIIKEI